MSKKGVLAFVYMSFFICSNLLYAQNIQKKRLLTEVLKDLETRYQCNFSYSDEDIHDIKIPPPPENILFKDAIAYLRNNTFLLFNILEDKFVTIILPDVDVFFICGTIWDYDTQAPIESATINTSFQSTISDEKGYFEIEAVKIGDTLEIKHIGYKTQNIEINSYDKECTKTWLTPHLQELDEVVVSNFITKGISKTSDGSFKINYNLFGILPGLIESDALQTVQSLPGIHSLDESVTNINIRGGSHDQNLITWNGIKMYQTGHFFSLISAFNPNMTNQVTLFKNGTPSSFTDGVSGTINIKSSDKINTAFKSTFGINLIDVNGLLNIPIGEKASIQISGRRSYSDLLNTHTSQHYFEKAFQNTEVIQNESNVISADDNFIFFDVEAVLNYKISKNDKLQISFLNTQNSLSFLESAFISNVEESRESKSEQRNTVFGLFYQRIWNNSFKTTLQLYGLNYALKAKNVDILNNKQLLQENSIKETEIKITSNYSINDKIILKGGYSFNESGIYNLDESNNPLYRIFSKDVLRKHALFTVFKFRSLNNETNLRFGVRINYIQPFNQLIIEPRLSFKYKLSDVLTWDVLGEFKHQTTTQSVDFQNDFLGIENRRWMASNNNTIPIIKSKQLSTGLTYKEKGWLINVEIFYKNIRGIVAQSQEFQNQYEFSKSRGNYFGKGAELLITKRINDLSVWVSYSYQDLNYQFKILQNGNFPNNFNLNHSFDIGAAYTLKNFKIATGLKWHSGKPTTNPVIGNEVINNVINYELANASNLPDYFRWDISLTYNFTIKKNINIHTGLSLWNITNKKNVVNKRYEFTDINFPTEVIQNSLEFVPNILFKVTF
ncbi:TonB-dependent receptor [Flavobacteriaceae bacterium AH-315-B10]|nr:TonB-dependent receptor [Flavobacteriaceae bacterium AH-315-B10]